MNDRCCISGCRRPPCVTYLKRPLCERHYHHELERRWPYLRNVNARHDRKTRKRAENRSS